MGTVQNREFVVMCDKGHIQGLFGGVEVQRGHGIKYIEAESGDAAAMQWLQGRRILELRHGITFLVVSFDTGAARTFIGQYERPETPGDVQVEYVDYGDIVITERAVEVTGHRHG